MSVSPPLSLTLSLCLYLPFSLSFFLSVCLSFSLSLSLSFFLCLPLSLPFSLSLSSNYLPPPSLSFSLSYRLCLPVDVPVWLCILFDDLSFSKSFSLLTNIYSLPYKPYTNFQCILSWWIKIKSPYFRVIFINIIQHYSTKFHLVYIASQC